LRASNIPNTCSNVIYRGSSKWPPKCRRCRLTIDRCRQPYERINIGKRAHGPWLIRNSVCRIKALLPEDRVGVWAGGKEVDRSPCIPGIRVEHEPYEWVMIKYPHAPWAVAVASCFLWKSESDSESPHIARSLPESFVLVARLTFQIALITLLNAGY